MKKSILLFSICFILISSISFSQSGWFIQQSGTINTLRDVFFVNSQTGWSVGDSGLIVRTTNGGVNWIQQVSNTTYVLRSVKFYDEQNGWIVGGTYVSSIPYSYETSIILKTNNGGTNWIVVSSASGSLINNEINLLDQNNYYIAFGGENWSLGFSLGNVTNTTNAGTNWGYYFSNEDTRYAFHSVHFINPNTGWVSGIYTTDVIPGCNAKIFKTTNHGVNWSNIKVDSGYGMSEYQYQKIRFADENTGYFLQNYFQKTINGGNNWFKVDSATTYGGKTFYFINKDTGWFVTSNGNIKRSNNGGLNWVNQNSPIAGFLGFYFINSLTGWAVGNNGNIIKTTTGGISISYSISGNVKYADNNQPVSSGMVKAFKLDKITGNIIILDTATIQPTGSYILLHVPIDSVDIGVFPNSTPPNDWVITYYPSTIYWQNATVIYPTGNMNNLDIYAYRMQITNANNSINGKIMRLTDVTTENLQDAFLYAKNGNDYVRCGTSDINGVYHLQSLPTDNLKIIVNRLGFTGDSTFVNVMSNSNIDSVNFSLNYLYTGIKQINEIVPTEYKLYQNYPNPFNPKTIIRFQIKDSRFVSLKIYDILGKEIATLVNEKLQAGTYETQFPNNQYTGNQLPSGIYFYKLTTDKFTDVKRMILIK